jgi:hypothetical protein
MDLNPDAVDKSLCFRPFPHPQNYFSRFYSAKSLVKPPNLPKNQQPTLSKQDKTFPKVVFSYGQSCKIELEEKTVRPGHTAGPNSFIWKNLAVTPIDRRIWRPHFSYLLQTINLARVTPRGGYPKKPSHSNRNRSKSSESKEDDAKERQPFESEIN